MYTYSEFKSQNGRNDSVSSVKVPFGYTAHLYENDGFQGKEWIVNGSMPSDSSMEWECVNAPAEYADMVSSLKISHSQYMEEAYGYWLPIATE